MISAYAPIVRALVVGAVIFALLTIGAAATYRLSGDRAVLLGSQIYAGVAVAFLGGGFIAAGLSW